MTAGDQGRLFYEAIADRFETLDHRHDVDRRLTIVFDELMSRAELNGKLVLDAGCGYGAFSTTAARAGARIVSLDIARPLVHVTVRKTSAVGVAADALVMPFRSAIFDAVISSEMIEHTERPFDVLGEFARVLKPGGLLIVTTPNRVWQSTVRWASRLRLRPFRGLENFLRWSEIESAIRRHGLDVERHVGFHAWPVHFGLSTVSTSVDRLLGNGVWARMMINQALAARKRK